MIALLGIAFFIALMVLLGWLFFRLYGPDSPAAMGEPADATVAAAHTYHERQLAWIAAERSDRTPELDAR
jgi:hypothetical protein